MILINDFITPEDLYQYIKFRTEQWHGKLDTLPDYNKSIQELSNLDMLKSVKINFNYFNRIGFGYNNKTYTFLNSENVDSSNFYEFIAKPKFNFEKRRELIETGASLKDFATFKFKFCVTLDW